MVTTCKKQFMDRTLTFPMSSVVNNRRWTMRALVILWLLCMIPQFAVSEVFAASTTTLSPGSTLTSVETSVYATIAKEGTDATQQAGTNPTTAATTPAKTSVNEPIAGEAGDATQQAGSSPTTTATTPAKTSVNVPIAGEAGDATQQAGSSPTTAATTPAKDLLMYTIAGEAGDATQQAGTNPTTAATTPAKTSVTEPIAGEAGDATQQAGTNPTTAATTPAKTSVNEPIAGEAGDATQQAATNPSTAATTPAKTSVTEPIAGEADDATQQAGTNPSTAATTPAKTSVNEPIAGEAGDATQQASTNPTTAAAITTVETSVKTKPPAPVPPKEMTTTKGITKGITKGTSPEMTTTKGITKGITKGTSPKPTIPSKTEQTKSVTIKIPISNLKSKLNKSRRRKKDATLDENDVKEIWREQYEQEFLNKVAEVTRKATGNEKFPQPEDIYYIDPTPLVVGNQLLVSFAIKYPGTSAEDYMDGSIVYKAMMAETEEFQSQLGISFEIEQGHNNVTPTSAPPNPLPPLILVILLLVAFLCLIIIIVGMMYLLCDKHLSSRRGEYITNCTVNNDSELGFDNPAMEEKDSNNAHLLGLRSDSEAQMIAPIGDFGPDQLRDYEVEDTHL